MRYLNHFFQRCVIFIFIIVSVLATSNFVQASDSLWASNFGPTGVDGTVLATIQWGDSTVVAGNFSHLANDNGFTSEFAIFDNIDESWKLVRNGPNGEIRSLAVNDNGDLILAGDFSLTYAGKIMDNLTVFGKDGSWNTLSGDSIDGPLGLGSINDILWLDGKLYIGGEFPFGGFSPALFIWDSVNGLQTPPDPLEGFINPNPIIRSMSYSAHYSRLYIAGNFFYEGINGSSRNLVWLDTENLNYHSIETPLDGTINIIMTDSNSHWRNRLVIGGEFDEIWNVTDSGLTVDSCGNIMIMDLRDDTWECLKNGVNGPVYALAARGDEGTYLTQVIVGGEFDSSGAIFTGPLSKWTDGTSTGSWTRFNPDLNDGAVYTIERDPIPYSSSRAKFIVGGSFEYLGDSARVNNIFATETGSFWTAYGDGLVRRGSTSISVNDIAVAPGGDIYVVGGFDYGGGKKLNYIGRWNTSGFSDNGYWEALDNGVTGGLNEVLVDGTTVYVAGPAMDSASGMPVNQIAMWDGSQWNAMGNGVPGASILDMEMDTLGNLYVCGSSLTTAGSQTVNGIAKWNGSSWEAVGEPLISNGPPVFVFDMHLDTLTNNLYVCGQFDLVGPTSENAYGVAMWDGVTWHALGDPIFRTTGSPNTIIINSDGDLVVSGTYAGRWIYRSSGDGVWTAYGGIVGGIPSEMISYGCNMYLCGKPLSEISAESFRQVARFDGQSWNGIDSGTNGHTYAMEAGLYKLYVAGRFKQVGNGVLANGFTYWKGIRAFGNSRPYTILTHESTDTLFYGETFAVAWANDASIPDLSFQYSTNNGANWNTVDASIDKTLGAFVWEIPPSINSDSVLISISGGSGCYDGTFGPYVMRHVPGLNVQRIYREYPNGKKTAFHPKVHGWQFSNTGMNQWPQSYVDAIDYTFLPVLTRTLIEQFEVDRSFFQDWRLFVKTWGADVCYHDTFGPNLYAVMKWSARQRGWAGSCYGFAVNAQSFFDHDRDWWNISEKFSAARNLFEVPIDNDSRDLINQFQARYRGGQYRRFISAMWKIGPTESLDSLLTYFDIDGSGVNGIHPMVYIANWQENADDEPVIGSAHEVFPYKVTNVPDSSDIIRVYVNDPNAPGSTFPYVRINLADDTWEYVGGFDWGFSYGFICGPPYQAAHDSKLFPTPQSTRNNNLALNDDLADDTLYITLGTSEWNDIVITTPTGDSLGQTTTGGSIRNSNLGIPVIEPGPHYQYTRAPEYFFPDTLATIELSNYDSSFTHLTWVHDSVIYNFERDNIINSQSDLLEHDDSWMYTNPDDITKSILMRTTASRPNFSWIMELQDISMAFNDSLSLEAVGDSLKIINDGQTKSIGLHIIVSGDTSIDEVRSDSVTISNNAIVTIIPDWTNLDYENVLILTDADGDNIYEDTVALDVPTSVGESDDNQLPNSYQLGQNYPNPFNPQTTIEFSLPVGAEVKINIYNLLGQKVKTVLDKTMAAGNHSIIWDGSSDAGQRVSSGIYFYRLQTDGFVSTKKMLLLK